jgi:hypothetical protein
LTIRGAQLSQPARPLSWGSPEKPQCSTVRTAPGARR